jgi:hypothetical protein
MMKSLRVALMDHAAKTKIVSWLMKRSANASPCVHTTKIPVNASDHAHSTLVTAYLVSELAQMPVDVNLARKRILRRLLLVIWSVMQIVQRAMVKDVSRQVKRLVDAAVHGTTSKRSVSVFAHSMQVTAYLVYARVQLIVHVNLARLRTPRPILIPVCWFAMQIVQKVKAIRSDVCRPATCLVDATLSVKRFFLFPMARMVSAAMESAQATEAGQDVNRPMTIPNVLARLVNSKS